MLAKLTQEKIKIAFMLISMTLMLIYIESVSLRHDVKQIHIPVKTIERHLTPKPLPVIQNEVDKCIKSNQVAFVKTHKTASSTVQNIFLRFAYNYNIPVGLPANNGARFFYPRKFMKAMTKPLPDGAYPAIIAHHLRASDQLEESFHDAKFITIVRSTPLLYESSFDYFRKETAPFRDAANITDFYNNPMKYINEEDQVGPKGGRVFAKNHMAFDLGLDNLSESNLIIGESLRKMDETFDLVMITDHFIESMVLLKHELCWNWKDVAYFITNARVDKIDVTPDLAAKMKSWNSYDDAIFNYFNATLWQKISALESFEEDKETLQKTLDELTSRCLETEVICAKGDTACSGRTNAKVSLKGFRLTDRGRSDDTCVMMTMTELELTRRLYMKQWPSWTNFYG